jgi:predicted small metal-binding protein
MKTITCEDLGGPCKQKLSAGSWVEMVEVMNKHVEENHPETAVEMEKMNSEDPEAWSKKMESVWEESIEDSI